MNYYNSVPLYYNPEQQQRLQKHYQMSGLRSLSNKLGFFVTAYFVSMYVIFFGLSILIGLGVLANTKDIEYLSQIFYAVGASLIPGIIFLAASKEKISSVLTHSHVKLTKLIPVLMFGMAVAMLANIAASIFDSNISLFSLENHATQDTEGTTMAEFWLSVLSTALVPAFAEEFAFRGIVLNRLRKYGDSLAIFGSALLFGAMHGNTTQVVFAFLLGLIFAYVDVKTNSIIPSVIIHFVNNFYAVLSNSIVVNNTVTEQQKNLFAYLMVFGFVFIGLLAAIYLAKSDKSFFKLNDTTEASGLLSFKDKISAFILNPGVMIALSLFTAEIIVNLIPPEVFTGV